MKKIIPPKLKKGDNIRVVAPSRGLGTISDENVTFAEERLQAMGFTVTYGAHVRERDAFGSSSIEARDILDVFVYGLRRDFDAGRSRIYPDTITSTISYRFSKLYCISPSWGVFC